MIVRMDPIVEGMVMYFVELMSELDSRFRKLDRRKRARVFLGLFEALHAANRVKHKGQPIWKACENLIRDIGPIARHFQSHPAAKSDRMKNRAMGISITIGGKHQDLWKEFIAGTDWILEYESDACLNWVRADLKLAKRGGRSAFWKRDLLLRKALRKSVRHMVWVLECVEEADAVGESGKSVSDIGASQTLPQLLEIKLTVDEQAATEAPQG
jgi:hypothetical protein